MKFGLSLALLVAIPTAASASACCTYNFDACEGGDWCNQSQSNCENNCNGNWYSLPFVIGDHCCGWGGNCGSSNYCNGKESNCGKCGGTWMATPGGGGAPAPTNPAPTAPAPTNPAPTAPAPTNPAPTAPAPTNPAPTAPAPTNPAPTAPAPTNPAPTAPAPTNPAPTAPTGGEKATTTRYWDCSGGACGCAYLPPHLGGDHGRPAHCYSNAMFAAPAGNPYGATFYGAAAISQALGGGDWMAEGCGKCWKVTGTSNIPGLDTTTVTTVVLKGTNYCPPSNAACSNGKKHFDIAAPGFDFAGATQANTCDQVEPDDLAALKNCGNWMIASSDPNANCDCEMFNNPVLKDGCNNFKSLAWNNPQVDFEEVACPTELSQLPCWAENGNTYAWPDAPDLCMDPLASYTIPAPTNPAPTAPAPTNPTPTAPAPTNPAPTAPAPTNPAPAPTPTSSEIGELTWWTGSEPGPLTGSSCEYANPSAVIQTDHWLDPYVKPKMYCAVSDDLFASGTGCGKCYRLVYDGVGGTDPATAGAADIQVVNSGAGGHKHFDCFEDAFRALTGISTGIFPVAYHQIDCVDSPLTAVVMDGGNAYYVKTLFAGGKTGVVAADITVGGVTKSMSKVSGATWSAGLSGARDTNVSYFVTFADGSTETLSNCHGNNWPVSTGSYCM